jgi:hypothetical protein
MRVFLSHSRLDTALIGRTRAALGILDTAAFALEDLPGARTVAAARTEIERQIRASELVFLLLTANATASAHTRAWIGHEVACASSNSKKLVVFQEPAPPPAWPVTYWTDLVVLSTDAGSRPIQMQRVVKGLKESAAPIAGAAGGALIGSVFGPLGTVVGAIIGGAGGMAAKQKQPPSLTCTKCGNAFRFWNPPGTLFYCPHCLRPIRFIAS